MIIDIETTGGSPKNSKITEIAIYKHDGEKVIDEFTSLVNPEIPIPPFIVQLTGINDSMVKTAPKFYEIAKQIIDFTEDCIFVAHNVGFDQAKLILNGDLRFLVDIHFPVGIVKITYEGYVIALLDCSINNQLKFLRVFNHYKCFVKN